jgi:hypothetical protein
MAPYPVGRQPYEQGNPAFPSQQFPPYPVAPPPRRGGTGKIVALVLGAVLLLGLLAAGGLFVFGRTHFGSTQTGAAPATTAPGASPSAGGQTASTSPGFADGQQVHSTALSVGDCVRSSAAGSVSDLETVACTASHDGEVIGQYTATGGDTYPGEAKITAEAETRCESYAPASLDNKSDLSIFYIYPREESWTSGDRKVECLVVSEGAPLTKRVADL